MLINNHSLNMKIPAGFTVSCNSLRVEMCVCVAVRFEFDLRNWIYSCHCGPSVSGKCHCYFWQVKSSQCAHYISKPYL